MTVAILDNTPGQRPRFSYYLPMGDDGLGDGGVAVGPPPGTQFVVERSQFDASHVVAEDGASLRAPTAAELLESARAAKLAALKVLRDAIQYDAFAYEGHWIDCDETARANLTGIQLSVVSGADPFPYQWRTADNVWLALPDRTTWAAMMECFEMHAKKTWAAYAVHEVAIAASADPASHDIAAGEWPDTRIDRGAF